MSPQTPAAPPAKTAGEVYATLLEQCSPLRWPPPWDFLPAGPDSFGPVGDDRAALALLRRRFDDDLLRRAGVLDARQGGDARLSPPLCDSAGAIIALRPAPGMEPFDLLTSRGSLLSRDPAPLVTARDGWTAQEAARRQFVLASFRVREVALLRALGLPATLATGLRRATPGQLRALDEAFRPAPPRPKLAFLGWHALELRREVPPLLQPLVAHLTAAQDHLHLDLSGLALWRPTSGDLEAVRFRAEYRDLSPVREAMDGAPPFMFPWDDWGDPDCEINREGPRPPRDCTRARAGLPARLREDHGASRPTTRGQEAYDEYLSATRRDLVRPLQEWALSQKDPVLRSAGAELADVCALLHRMSPAVHEVQAREVRRRLAGRSPNARDDLFTQYGRLAARTGELTRILDQARRCP